MRRKGMKVLATMLCVMMMGMTVCASSPNTSTTTEPVEEYAEAYQESMAIVLEADGTDAKIDGVAGYVGIVMEPVLTSKVEEAVTVAQSLVSANANVLHMAEVSLSADVEFDTIQIKFAVDGVSSGQGIMCLHQKSDGTWEAITPDTVDAGYVTVTFTSLSPVAFVSYGTSPKTGEAFPIVAGVMVLALLGSAIVLKVTYKHQ
ncbi:MAG: hypothetical protein R3Y47_00305 [Lachnospiraceae bacterium]